jgi:hypothetical protein
VTLRAVIWSNKAKQSGWVNAEIANFLANTNETTDRKLVCPLLEGTNLAYDPIQMLQELLPNNAYAADPQNLPVHLLPI